MLKLPKSDIKDGFDKTGRAYLTLGHHADHQSLSHTRVYIPIVELATPIYLHSWIKIYILNSW